MEKIPVYVELLMYFSTILVVFLFYKASGFNKKVFIVLCLWLGLQSIIAGSGFYLDTVSMPPKFLLAIGIPIIFIIVLLFTKKGRSFLDGLDNRTLTLLHIVRIPVEFTLLALFLYKTIPGIMTFEGWNMDIFSGLTAPLLFLSFKKKSNRTLLLIWNFLALGLLINIVTIAILSAPFPFQRLAFDQPNQAVFYFPFIWLPCCIVPIVLLSHVVVIRRLLTAR